MKHDRYLSLIFALLQLCRWQSSYGQTTDPFRLTGTRTDYRYFYYQEEWTGVDSSSFVYSQCNFRHNTLSPNYYFNGLNGRLAVPIDFDASYYYEGLFPVVSYPIIVTGSLWKYDEMNTYQYITWEDTWKNLDWKSRTYTDNQIAHMYSTYENEPANNYYINHTIEGLPETFLITSGSNSDSLQYYTFQWEDDRLQQYTSYIGYPNLTKNDSHEYFFNADLLVQEEWVRKFTGYPEEISYLYKRWTFTYNADGYVTRIQQFLPDNGGWVSDWDKHIVMEGDLPVEVRTLTRNIDTLASPTYTDAWDTLDLTRLYFSDSKLDSVIKMLRSASGVLSPFSSEYFSYTDDMINIYDLKYADNVLYVNNQHINHVYDENGRLTAIYKRFDYENFSNAYDTLFYYDTFGNIILKELYEGTSYEQPCTYVSTEPVKRIHYYYEQVPFAGTSDGDLFVHIFPSPANEQFAIEMAVKGDLDNETELLIANMQGKVIYRKTLAPGISFHQVDCSDWTSGMYAICVRQDENVAWQKVMVK